MAHNGRRFHIFIEQTWRYRVRGRGRQRERGMERERERENFAECIMQFQCFAIFQFLPLKIITKCIKAIQLAGYGKCVEFFRSGLSQNQYFYLRSDTQGIINQKTGPGRSSVNRIRSIQGTLGFKIYFLRTNLRAIFSFHFRCHSKL